MSSGTIEHEFADPLDVDLSGGLTITIPSIPKISVGLDPITINPLTVTVNPLTINPIDVTVRLREFPSIRAHLPANYTLGLSILGFELLCLRLCGEAQLITEPYDPNPCEDCEDDGRKPPDQPTPVPGPAPVPK